MIALRYGLVILVLSSVAQSHEGHHHGKHSQEQKKADASSELSLAYTEIDTDYKKNVQPVFEIKCAACHSEKSPGPWYASIPGLHRLIESDRSEAKDHIEISKGFPFAGHGEPIEDLKAIAKDVSEGEMPPLFYSLMHPSSKLTPFEKEKVLAWVRSSQLKLAVFITPEKKP